jgi:tRNA modification GTPase
MIDNVNDTIVAQSTLKGNAAIAIVRVSGSKSSDIFKKVSKVKRLSHKKVLYKIISNGSELIDDAQCVYFEGPKSYTGEDSFEIYCHGNQIIVNKIISYIVELGARVASRGEFTKRAYLNGKMNLFEAESVIDIINAENEMSLKLARRNREGAFSKEIIKIKEEILKILVLAEVEIDFNDQDVEIYDSKKVLRNLEVVDATLDKLITNFEISKKIREGIKITLCGDVNVGKSTIFNLLVNEDRAIVSPNPGTTRDVISERASISSINATIFDTAGLRMAEESIEIQGVERAHKRFKDTDLFLFISAANNKATLEIIDQNGGINKHKSILVINKTELSKQKSDEKFDAFYDVIYMSALENNCSELKKSISRYIDDKINVENQLLVNERQFFSLKIAKNFISNAINEVGKPDLLSYELRSLTEELENLIGEVSSDDVLGQIFSNFCIGK